MNLLNGNQLPPLMAIEDGQTNYLRARSVAMSSSNRATFQQDDSTSNFHNQRLTIQKNYRTLSNTSSVINPSQNPISQAETSHSNTVHKMSAVVRINGSRLSCQGIRNQKILKNNDFDNKVNRNKSLQEVTVEDLQSQIKTKENKTWMMKPYRPIISKCI